MTRYFLDAWFFIALLNRFDEHQLPAHRLRRALIHAPLFTHDGVFSELLAHVSAYGMDYRRRAASYVRNAFQTITVFPSDRKLVLAGLHLYERRLDKEYSLIDCMSMELMRTQDIRHVLTNDHHFRQEGFTVLSDAP